MCLCGLNSNLIFAYYSFNFLLPKMNIAKNPILRGFNPDPSIIRVGDDYYIATSTFEWFPGVQIHHSKDLKNWKLVTHPLQRVSQLDMLGVPDSCGVWAPCLSYCDGIFYLVYSNVKSFDGVWKDTPNYLVMTDDILGEWSEPIFLNSAGFDGSMFHDEENGKKYFTSMICDQRKGRFFGGIILQEFDLEQKKLVGKMHYLTEGTDLGLTEAPHIFKRNGFYYLILAEGGTEYGHAFSLLRSRKIKGPYEVHPQNPIISSRENPKAILQKAGHGDFVETQNGEWFAVFLVGRPLTKQGRCTLGRETAIEAMEWRTDDWIYLKQGGRVPRVEVPLPDLPEYIFEKNKTRDDFNDKKLDLNFQSLRVPMTEDWVSLKERNGFLRIYGRESLSSFHRQSMIARRVQNFKTEVTCCIEFEPKSFQQMAGLVCYYNTGHFHYLHIFGNDDGSKKFLNVISYDKYFPSEALENPIDITIHSRVFLKVFFNYDKIQFFYSTNEKVWKPVGQKLDGSILSDDYVQQDPSGRYRPAFTGSFIGLCCQDLSGQKLHADFDWIEFNG